MSTAAVMLVKDEADVIEHTVRHLLANVDEVIVADNLSTDGTYDRLLALQREDDSEAHASGLRIQTDEERGYWQSRKTTALAMEALERGHHWVIPVDADEVWYAPDGRTLSEYLDGVPPDVQMVTAELYNHLPSSEDPLAYCSRCAPYDPSEGVLCEECHVRGYEPNPLRRIGWRQRQRAPLGKVACRLRPDLIIEAGNHSARTSGTALATPGLVIRHFSWRDEAQYLRKIRNGERAYAETDLPDDIGKHWRAFAGKPDDAVIDHFRTWFFSNRPYKDGSLIYDPAPIRSE